MKWTNINQSRLPTARRAAEVTVELRWFSMDTVTFRRCWNGVEGGFFLGEMWPQPALHPPAMFDNKLHKFLNHRIAASADLTRRGTKIHLCWKQLWGTCSVAAAVHATTAFKGFTTQNKQVVFSLSTWLLCGTNDWQPLVLGVEKYSSLKVAARNASPPCRHTCPSVQTCF